MGAWIAHGIALQYLCVWAAGRLNAAASWTAAQHVADFKSTVLAPSAHPDVALGYGKAVAHRLLSDDGNADASHDVLVRVRIATEAVLVFVVLAHLKTSHRLHRGLGFVSVALVVALAYTSVALMRDKGVVDLDSALSSHAAMALVAEAAVCLAGALAATAAGRTALQRRLALFAAAALLTNPCAHLLCVLFSTSDALYAPLAASRAH